jgi:hypothetical protein
MAPDAPTTELFKAKLQHVGTFFHHQPQIVRRKLSGQALYFDKVYKLVQEERTDAAHHVIDQKTFGAPCALQRCTEEIQSVHIEKDVTEIVSVVHEHVRNDLPRPKQWTGHVMPRHGHRECIG